MVNYVCRTCLYVCDDEFSFRRLEKVKQILALFMPEIKTFTGKYTLICEQCYYFLKNVEKFKTKCIETHKKLYSMNIETIKDAHNAVLQSVANEAPLDELHGKTLSEQRLKRSVGNSRRKTCKKSKPDTSCPLASTVTSEREVTVSSLLNTCNKLHSSTQPSQSFLLTQQTKPAFPVEVAKPVSPLNQDKKMPLNLSAADDLLLLFNNDITDMERFREFAVKCTNKELEKPNDTVVLRDNNKEVVTNYEDDDEYMTRSDLVLAGILSDDSNKSANEGQQGECDGIDDPDVIEIYLSDSASGENEGVVKFKVTGVNEDPIKNKLKPETTENPISNYEIESVSMPIKAIVKKEIPEDKNPGFFNRQSSDGYYECLLCSKAYKTSNRLYEHTKKIHVEVKIHHCDYCSFFTLWKSASVRHNSIFHMFEKNNHTLVKCYHCTFQSRSKEKLSRHILDKHVLTKTSR